MPEVCRVALVGDFNPKVVAHQAIPRAIDLSAAVLQAHVSAEWVDTTDLRPAAAEQLGAYDAVWLVPASPYADMEMALQAVTHARNAQVPFLGTCGGFQHALLEIIHNLVGKREAAHAEVTPDAEMAVIMPLACSMVGQQGEISFSKGSRLEKLLGPSRVEGYHCSYGFDPAQAALLAGTGVRFTGHDAEGQPRAFELEGHPFFNATLFQPERSALKDQPHPLITAFLQASLNRAAVRPQP